MLSYFCWPWRFPELCSARGSVWKRWHGSLWTAIFHVDLLYRLESGRQDRKRDTEGTGGELKGHHENISFFPKKETRVGQKIFEERKGREGKRSRQKARLVHFSHSDGTTAWAARLMSYIDQPQWKRDSFSKRMGPIQLKGVKETFSPLKDNPYYSIQLNGNITKCIVLKYGDDLMWRGRGKEPNSCAYFLYNELTDTRV